MAFRHSVWTENDFYGINRLKEKSLSTSFQENIDNVVGLSEYSKMTK